MSGVTITANVSSGYYAGVSPLNPVVVAPGVTVSGNTAGVSITGSTTVINQGSITAQNSSGSGYSFTGGVFVALSGAVLLGGGAVTNASGAQISSYLEGVAIGAGGSVVNAGTILASGTQHGFGIALEAGGYVANQINATINAGYMGIFAGGGAASIKNSGLITGTSTMALFFGAGGTVTNQATGTITSPHQGISAAHTPFTVFNQGTIQGVASIGINANTGASINNSGTGRISGGYYGVFSAGTNPVSISNGAGGTISGGNRGLYTGANVVATVANSGLIIGYTKFGIYAAGSGSIVNNAPGRIQGASDGLFLSGNSTVTNTGVIYGVNYVGGWLDTGGVLTNSGPGLIKGFSVGLRAGNARATVTNNAVITAFGVTNSSGALLATRGVYFSDGGILSNQSGGTITGPFIGAELLDGDATVANQGTITASDGIGRGVVIAPVAATTTTSAGILNSATIINSGTGYILGGAFGVQVAGAAATVANTGTILATKQLIPGTVGFYSAGVRLGSGGVLTNNAGGYIHSKWMGLQSYGSTSVVNSGTIKANDPLGDGAGVWINGPATITNAATGLISGGGFGVVVYNTTTLVNQGTIFGASVAFDAANAPGFAQHIIDTPGATFIGTVESGNPVTSTIISTVELTSAASTGTIGNIGTFIGFSQITIDAGAHWSLGGGISAGETAIFGGRYGDLILGSPGAQTGTIAGFTNTDTIELSGISDVTGLSWNGNTLTVHEASSAIVPLIFDAPQTAMTFTANGASTDLVIPCFLPGTHILTDRGEVQVEHLKLGDTIITLSGRQRRLCWIGQGSALATRGQRSAATPIIVRKGALADGVPHRDLRITKGHSLYLDGVLIPAEFLVNHRSIIWDDRAQEVTVFHLELDEHDVLLADGAPAESYRDDGNRWLFRNANDGWDQPAKPPCAPVLTGGAVVDAIWRRLLDRAGPRPGIPLTDEPDLHLIVDGLRVDPAETVGAASVFRLARRPGQVAIASRAVVPAEIGLARDARSIGVAVRSLAIRQGTRFKVLRARDAAPGDGFHPYESDRDLRWTDGYATLMPSAFDGFDGAVEVMLEIAETTRYPVDAAAGDRMVA